MTKKHLTFCLYIDISPPAPALVTIKCTNKHLGSCKLLTVQKLQTTNPYEL